MLSASKILDSIRVEITQPGELRYFDKNKAYYLDYTERKLLSLRMEEQARRWRKITLDPASKGGEWAAGFASRYPQAASYAVPLRFVSSPSALRGDSIPVRAGLGQTIEIYTDFWKLDEGQQDYEVLAAIGEMLLSGNEKFFEPDARKAGIDPMVFSEAGYRAFGPPGKNRWPDFIHGFGRAFALYFTDEAILRKKYPKWYEAIVYFLGWTAL